MVEKRARVTAASRLAKLAEAGEDGARRLRELASEEEEIYAEDGIEPPTTEVPAWPEESKEEASGEKGPSGLPSGEDL